MKFTDLFVGALSLNTQVMSALRERSDVFLRGFVVLLFAALFAGVFAAIEPAISNVTPLVSQEEVVAQARSSFESSYNGPVEMKAMFETYAVETASMVYDLLHLPPRAGEGARPVVAILDFVGRALGTPFTWAWAGWMLFAGLLIQFSSRLLGGRASVAQMLGLTALAAAPQIFTSLTALLGLIANAGNIGALGTVNSLLGFVIGIWSLAVYIKATSIAQNFSLGRSIGAMLLGFVILTGIAIVLLVLFALGVASLVTIVSSSTVR